MIATDSISQEIQHLWTMTIPTCAVLVLGDAVLDAIQYGHPIIIAATIISNQSGTPCCSTCRSIMVPDEYVYGIGALSSNQGAFLLSTWTSSAQSNVTAYNQKSQYQFPSYLDIPMTRHTRYRLFAFTSALSRTVHSDGRSVLRFLLSKLFTFFSLL